MKKILFLFLLITSIPVFANIIINPNGKTYKLYPNQSLKVVENVNSQSIYDMNCVVVGHYNKNFMYIFDTEIDGKIYHPIYGMGQNPVRQGSWNGYNTVVPGQILNIIQTNSITNPKIISVNIINQNHDCSFLYVTCDKANKIAVPGNLQVWPRSK